MNKLYFHIYIKTFLYNKHDVLPYPFLVFVYFFAASSCPKIWSLMCPTPRYTPTPEYRNG